MRKRNEKKVCGGRTACSSMTTCPAPGRFEGESETVAAESLRGHQQYQQVQYSSSATDEEYQRPVNSNSLPVRHTIRARKGSAGTERNTSDLTCLLVRICTFVVPAMSAHQSESGERQGTDMESDAPHMVVPGDQVQKFLRSLREYSESCAQSRKDILASAKSVSNQVLLCEKAATACSESEQCVKRQLDERLREVHAEHDVLTTERESVKKLADKAADDIAECKRIARRVSGHDSLVRTVADAVKLTESAIRKQYTRALYATSVCRQMTMCALKTMESTLGLVKTLRSRASIPPVMDNAEAEKDMIDVDASNSSMRHHTNTQQLEAKLDSVVRSVRNLQLDLDDIERTVRVLDDISLLDEAITSAYEDNNAFEQQVEGTVARRMEVERLVRQTMPFDRTTYTTLVNYEAVVMVEVSKRMKASELNGSRILSGVVDSLVRSGVNAAGDVPDIIKQCDERKDSQQ